MDKQFVKKCISTAMLLLCVLAAGVLIKAYTEGKFVSVSSLQEYIAGFGLLSPFVLTTVQALQVVIPILPGFLGCAVGAVLFGSLGGFICNYIGISGGSIAAFFLARKYGIKLVKSLLDFAIFCAILRARFTRNQPARFDLPLPF